MAAKAAISGISSVFATTVFVAVSAFAPAAAEDIDDTVVGAQQPMTIVVSLSGQSANIYRGMSLITSTKVSTGKRGYSTKAGVYSILEKRRRHFSNLYAGAPMPWMQRLTWTGTALHAGVVPGYPASHGCIRLPYSFAPKLFAMTSVGAQVVVASSMVSPKLIEHPALFQPVPPPMPPMLSEGDAEVSAPDAPVMRKSSNDTVQPVRTRLPVVLARANAVTPKATPLIEARIPAPATDRGITIGPVAAARLEDTSTHAIDPGAAPFLGSGSHGFAVKPSSDERVARVGTSDDFMKHQDRLDTGAPTPAQAESPEARPVLTVTAAALAQPAPKPAYGFVRAMTADDHPPLPPVKPSVMAAKFVAGATAAAKEAAEPRSTAPIRILVTRRTRRDQLVDMQYLLSSMGHLAPQNFDGTLGRATVSAIKSFQKANDLPQTGSASEEMIKKIYEIAGKEEPPIGRLFVRQEFQSVLSAPIHFRNEDKPLGTHLFTVMNFEEGATEAQWTAISLNDKEDASSVLDRIEIPEDLRRNIAERLTPGSSLIVADTAINSASLPKGADFLVWDTTNKPAVVRASTPRKKRRVSSTRRPTYTRTYRKPRTTTTRRGFGRGWPF